jgi:Caspase domain
MNIGEGIKKGLIISVSDYDILQPLEFCKNDGNEMYEILKTLGYEIQADHKLIGRVKWIEMRSAIVDFFRNSNVKPSDTLLFYYSGHGVLENGDHYLAIIWLPQKLIPLRLTRMDFCLKSSQD